MLTIAIWSLPTAICVILGWHSRRNIQRLASAFGVFLMSILAWYAIELLVFPVAIQQYTDEQIMYAVGCVALCLTGFLAGYLLPTKHPPAGTSTKRWIDLLDNPDYVWNVFLFLTLVGIVPLLWIAKGNLLVIFEDAFLPRKRWSSMFQRARYGDVRDAILELQMFLRAAVIPACIVIFSSLRWQSLFRKCTAAIIVAYAIARALNDGARISVIEVTMPVAASLYWITPSKGRSWFLLFGAPTIAAIGIVWAVATVVGRDEGKFEWKMAAEARYTGFEMSRELLFLTGNVPDNFPYQWGKTYWAQLINPIPRFVWAAKPSLDAGLQLARLQGQVINDEPKLTVAPGLIGEMYWNFGLPGIVFISIGIGWLACRWDQFGSLQTDSLPRFLIFASGLGIIFASGRSINMSCFYSLIALYATIQGANYWIKTPRCLI